MPSGDSRSLKNILTEVTECNACADLPLGPRPVVQAGSQSRILIVGQAPGKAVHLSGVPWNDASGERLRDWIGLSTESFYDPQLVSIVPMGFCYPGTGASGDLPPRPQCFNIWHEKILSRLPSIRLTLLVGAYAQRAYLKRSMERSLTETVRAWRDFLPVYLPLPHPSPLNNIWLSKNRWFEGDVAEMRASVSRMLSDA